MNDLQFVEIMDMLNAIKIFLLIIIFVTISLFGYLVGINSAKK